MPHWATGLVTCLCLFTNLSSFLYSSFSSTVPRLFPGSTSMDIKWHVSSWVWLSSLRNKLQLFDVANDRKISSMPSFSFWLHHFPGWFPWWLHSLPGYTFSLAQCFVFLQSIYHLMDTQGGYCQFLAMFCTAINRSSVLFVFEILFPSDT